MNIFYEEAFPLWLVAPLSSGGLGWSPSAVGSLIATGGAFLAISQFVIFPRLSRRFALSSLFKWSAGLLAFVLGCTPYLASAGPLLLPLLLLQNALNRGLTSTCFTTVFLFINNSCHARHRGRVNGLGMSLSSGFKAAGPMLGAMLFAWSLTDRDRPSVIPSDLVDVHLTFLTCGLLGLGVLAAAVYSFGPANDRPLPEPTHSTRPAVEAATCECGSAPSKRAPSAV